MTCEPYCERCGGNRGFHSVDDVCKNCQTDELRKGRKERIRKDEFDASRPDHFRLQTRGGAWRYYRKVGS